MTADSFLLAGLLFSSVVCGVLGQQDKVCRLSSVELNQTDFDRYSCTQCYLWIPEELFHKQFKYSLQSTNGFLWDKDTQTELEPDYQNPESPAYQSFRDPEDAVKWGQCCQAARQCCVKMMRKPPGEVCPGNWDGYGCWEDAKPGQRQEIDCPDYHHLYYTQERSPCRRFVRKDCLPDGTWRPVEDFCAPCEFQRNLEGHNVSDDLANEGCMRTEREIDLTYTAYMLDTCARCYNYLKPNTLINRLKYNKDTGQLESHNDSVFARWNKFDESELIYNTFPKKTSALTLNWVDCCKAAERCWTHMAEKDKGEAPIGSCPMTWGGWDCFDYAKPGETKYTVCPNYVFFESTDDMTCKTKSKRECTENGIWYFNKKRNMEYTDYRPCTYTVEIRRRLYYETAMFVISIVAIIPALIIFHVYRSLRVPRIKMHVQFFVSLLLYCLTGVIFRATVLIPETTRTIDYGAYCKTINIVNKYCRVCSYFWMLNEGFYLHRQIAAAFSEQRRFWYFYVIGWGFPALILAIFAIIQKSMFDTRCWIVPNETELIIQIFSLLALITNLGFLCHIVYILITKLRSVQSNEPSHFRKAVRATVVLIPLFGAHYFLTIYTPKDSCTAITISKYFTATVDGLQGLAVAIIYCYLNNEVLNLLRKDYHRYKLTKWIGQRTERPSRGRWSVSTQVSAVHDNHSVNQSQPRNGRSSDVGISTVDVPTIKPPKSNGNIPVTEL